jgi:predicted acetyltransferase
MINPFDYLWHKLYKVLKSSTDKSMAFVLFINSLTFIVLLFRSVPKWIILFLIMGLFIMNYYDRRGIQAKILKKYRCESERSRIIGNIIVTVYIIT